MAENKNTYTIKFSSKRNKRKDGTTFVTYRMLMNLIVIGEDGKKSSKKQPKWIDLKFRKEVEGLKKLKRGFLVVKEENLDAPFVYEVKEATNEETGETYNVFPTAWIKNEYEEYIEELAKHEQSDFDVVEASNDTSLSDEADTSETDLGDSEESL